MEFGPSFDSANGYPPGFQPRGEASLKTQRHLYNAVYTVCSNVKGPLDIIARDLVSDDWFYVNLFVNNPAESLSIATKSWFIL